MLPSYSGLKWVSYRCGRIYCISRLQGRIIGGYMKIELSLSQWEWFIGNVRIKNDVTT
jgi:hypothetical protein